MFRRKQQEPDISPSQPTTVGDTSSDLQRLAGGVAANGKQPDTNQMSAQAGRTDQWGTISAEYRTQPTDPAVLASTVINNQQLVLITQLMQITTTMHRVNELFLWLARALVQRLGIQVVQFWTNQEVALQPQTLELQRMACQSELLPQYIVVNDQVTQLVRYIGARHIPSVRQPVEAIFPHQQATLLKHYGLNYCASYILHSNTWNASDDQPLVAGQIPAPLLVVALLFFQHPPSQKLHVSIEHILEQALLTARNRGLLQFSASTEQSPSQKARQSTAPITAPPTLKTTNPALQASAAHRYISGEDAADQAEKLIPRRINDIHLMRSSNPLASSVDIRDRQLRRVYAAIDGHKSVKELALATRLTMNELKLALQMLIQEQRIWLYRPGGEPAGDAQSLDML